MDSRTTTRTVRKTEIVGVSSLAWIRPVNVKFTASNTKPNTVMYPFFDGQDVSLFVNGGAQLKTDSSGNLSGTFAIPPFTFNTGDREFKLQESSVYTRNDIQGSVFGSARATFSTSGVQNTLRETVETFNDTTFFNRVEIIQPQPQIRGPQDPLAQSFFTYGVDGGCFITAIELYFQSKDAAIPVILEIRELVNGLPGNSLANAAARVTLPPAYVAVSTNATAPTKFIFPCPIYLPENRDWCFVLISNSNAYHVWTSKIGERSQETGGIIFEQPFIGSMFKSENNITWSPEQTEDIKFKIYKAKFLTQNPGTLTMNANANAFLLDGSRMTVASGSAKVIVNFEHQHGLRTNDYIQVEAFDGADFRGIPASSLTSTAATDFSVVVLDDYRIEFFAKSPATSSGDLSASGVINDVLVDSAGSGYPSNTTMLFSDPPAGGTLATGDLVIVDGAIKGIVVTNPGSGYTSLPTITLSATTANPASFTIVSRGIFQITTNNVAHGFKPTVVSAITPNTKISGNLKTTDSNYQIGDFQSARVNAFQQTNKHNLILSQKNNNFYLPGQESTAFSLQFSSTNENTSPILAVNEPRKLQTYAYSINNFPSYSEEVVAALPISGEDQVVYFRTSDSSEWVWNGSAWVSLVSEFAASGGGARSKYLTKQFALETISKGARVFLTACSFDENGIDVYMRTSLSSKGQDHKQLRWKKMSCDVARNLSRKNDEYIDYTFYLDDIESFDIYDLKIVMLSSNKAIVPRISNYRAIVLAT